MRLRKRYCFMTVLAFMFFNDLRLPGCAPGAAFSCASGAAICASARWKKKKKRASACVIGVRDERAMSVRNERVI